jgi:hypothetical protein
MPGSRSVLRQRLLRRRPSHPSRSRSRPCPKQSRPCPRRPIPKCPKWVSLRVHRLLRSLSRHSRPRSRGLSRSRCRSRPCNSQRSLQMRVLGSAFARCVHDRSCAIPSPSTPRYHLRDRRLTSKRRLRGGMRTSLLAMRPGRPRAGGIRFRPRSISAARTGSQPRGRNRRRCAQRPAPRPIGTPLHTRRFTCAVSHPTAR